MHRLSEVSDFSDLNSEKSKTVAKVVMCTSCETNNASHYCTETICSSEDHIEYLCSDCVKMHKRLKATKNHVISTIQLEKNEKNVDFYANLGPLPSSITIDWFNFS